MLISIRRSGGFAGIDEPLGTIDTSQMQVPEANKLARRVNDLARNAAGADQPVSADLFRYDIVVRNDDGEKQTFTILHSGDPAEPLPQPLLELLHAL